VVVLVLTVIVVGTVPVTVVVVTVEPGQVDVTRLSAAPAAGRG
jgi:hypothetical protein